MDLCFEVGSEDVLGAGVDFAEQSSAVAGTGEAEFDAAYAGEEAYDAEGLAIRRHDKNVAERFGGKNADAESNATACRMNVAERLKVRA